MEKTTPASAAAALDEYWSQQVIARANGNLFKVAKGTGSTTWHTHEDQDEALLLLSGRLTVALRSGPVELTAGDLFVVPRGVEHRPDAGDEDVLLLLIGPEVTSTAAGGKPAWSRAGGRPPQ